MAIARENDAERVMLFLVGLLGMGAAYCYDSPSALKSQLQHHFLSIPPAEFEVYFNLFYTVYSIPNVLLPFIGGILCDRWGSRSMLFVLTSVVLVGQTVFAFGCSVESMALMLMGRMTFGLAGETIAVAQCSLVATWFPSHHLALVMGLIQTASKLGTALNDELSPLFAYWFHVSIALWIGAFFASISVAVAVLATKLDERHLSRATSINVSTSMKKPFCLLLCSRSFWLVALAFVALMSVLGPFTNVASSVLLERDFFKPHPNAACRRCGVGAYANDPSCLNVPAAPCPPSPPFAYPLPYLPATCTHPNASTCTPSSTTSVAVSPPFLGDFIIDCDDDDWRYNPATINYCLAKHRALQAAATPMSLPSLTVALTAPCFGYVVDSVGQRPLLAAGAHLLLLFEHLLLSWTTVVVAIPMVLQGLATSLFVSVMWSAIPYCVEDHHVGTAYGLVTSLWNVGLAIVPVAVAYIVNYTHMYLPSVDNICCLFSCLGLVTCLYLSHFDRRYCRHSLSRPQMPKFVEESPLIDRARFHRLSHYGSNFY
ncbi:Aste57867_10803 [Aphanomyces stellatus]|uniref:Lysosomal dipeptide transporter MFSD1 n=1 Tax=Aphanomyces stellatus TaxID=120398 RepID=A0A485KRV4_9STRA|nr:hypothetical protein As57867_010763 [Aphanomyces stellatus]VFT87672.1 Aste57867_10803 [Aphanomyces stellatus]